MTEKITSNQLPASRAQVGRFFDAIEGQFLDFTRDELQEAIEKGGLLAEYAAGHALMFNDLLKKFNVLRLSGPFEILVDYDAADAIRASIKANAFDIIDKTVDFDIGKMPLVRSGQLKQTIREYRLSGITSCSSILPTPRPGFRYADPLTALHYRLSLPVQPKYPLVVIFKQGKDFYFLGMGPSGNESEMIIRQVRSGFRFLFGTRLLIVPQR